MNNVEFLENMASLAHYNLTQEMLLYKHLQQERTGATFCESCTVVSYIYFAQHDENEKL